jgi:signal transduction histidine kinase
MKTNLLFILRLKSTLFLSTLLILCACSDKKENSTIIFPKPPDEPLDSVSTWLSNKDNYLTDKYLPFFYTHFNQQITVNNLDSAARLLSIVGGVAYDNFAFDTILIQTHLDFLAKYETRIPYRFRASLYNNLGDFYSRRDVDFDKCLFFYRKNNSPPTNYHDALQNAVAKEGQLYYFSMLTYPDSALFYGLSVLDFYEKHEEWAGTARVCRNIFYSYNDIEDNVMAEKYARLSIEAAKKAKDSTMIFGQTFALTRFLYNIDTARFFLSVDSLEQFEAKWQPKDPKFDFLVQSTRGLKWLVEGNNGEVEKILKKLVPLFPLMKEQGFESHYFTLVSRYEIENNKPLSFASYYLENINMLEQTKNFESLEENYDYLGQDAELKKDYKMALEYFNKSVAARDSSRNNKIQYQTRELEKKYQTEKKEAQLQLQAEEALIKNVFIGFLVLGLLAFGYFYSLLSKKNTTISQQNELNEQTIAILSHDIKEPLLGVKLMLKKLNKDDPFVAQASQSLEGQINSVNGILTNLLKMKKASLVKKDKNATANANAVVQNVVGELSVAIQTKALTINNELTDDVLLPIAPEKLQIIVHNLLSNAVKYSFPNQQIRIFKEGKGICIQDFGIGLSPEQRTKLMREVTASQRGTNQERGNGLGLFLVGAMLQGEQLKVVFDSPEVGGTIAKVLG